MIDSTYLFIIGIVDRVSIYLISMTYMLEWLGRANDVGTAIAVSEKIIFIPQLSF